MKRHLRGVGVEFRTIIFIQKPLLFVSGVKGEGEVEGQAQAQESED